MTDRLDAAVRELVDALRAEIVAAPSAAPEPDRLLNIPEAAAALGISRTALYGEVQSGALRSVKVGRRRLIPTGSVASYIANRLSA